MNEQPDVEELARLLGGACVQELSRLLGGASRQTWAFRLDGRRLVLRRDQPGAPSGVGMEREAALLRAAARAGLAVPELIAAGPDFLVLAWVNGETLARRILRDATFAPARERLLRQCGEQLAWLHTRVPPAQVPGLVGGEPLERLRGRLDAIDEPHPAFEVGLRWLQEHRPPTRTDVVLHGDFRLGNLMVDGDGLVAVLDWELAHLGDPLQDLAWLCVRSWRFGSPLPAAGVGTRQELAQAYEDAGGAPVDFDALHWWEAFCTLDWGVMCLEQSRAHLDGRVRSVELAAIGRRVCEVELDLLDLLPGGEVHPPVPAPEPDPLVELHDRPTAAELIEAVREFVEGLPVNGHDRFLTRVSAGALRIVERELLLGPTLAREHADRLAALGVSNDTELAAVIRSGEVQPAQVLPSVRAAVVAKLLVADPSQLIDRYRAGPTRAPPSSFPAR